MHYMYRITNRLNGRVYIGQTNDPEYRWKQHQNCANRAHPPQYIQRAMAKHGIDNFVFEVIATCKTKEDANETERILIKQYDSQNKEFGYNLAPGGGVGTPSDETRQRMSESAKQRVIDHPHTNPATFGFTGADLSEEARAAIAEAKRGQQQSEETRQKRSESLAKYFETHDGWSKGLPSPKRGIPLTEEHKRKVSEALTGYKHTETTRANAAKRMIGNTYCVGREPWNKGLKGVNTGHIPWNRGMSLLSDDQKERIISLYDDGLTQEQVAEKVQCDPKSVARWLAINEIDCSQAISDETKRRMIAFRSAGLSYTKISEELECDLKSVIKWLKLSGDEDTYFISDEMKRQMVELRSTGMTQQNIATKLGCNIKSVGKWLKLTGANTNPKTISEQTKQRMVELRATGMSYDKIANELGCNYKSVAKWLKLKEVS